VACTRGANSESADAAGTAAARAEHLDTGLIRPMARTRTRWHLDPARIYRRCVSQKVSFRTRQDALDRAERQMEAGQVNPGCHIVPYECPDCGQWHLTNRIIVPMDPRHQRTTFQIVK
jgi:hypothetical protein